MYHKSRELAVNPTDIVYLGTHVGWIPFSTLQERNLEPIVVEIHVWMSYHTTKWSRERSLLHCAGVEMIYSRPAMTASSPFNILRSAFYALKEINFAISHLGCACDMNINVAYKRVFRTKFTSCPPTHIRYCNVLTPVLYSCTQRLHYTPQDPA